jgi:uncharacterized protein (DUF58 family)
VSNSQKYFDPETLARIRPLGLRARTLVEGLVAGLHRSPVRGQSIEFSQHREYVPGDDLRQVDWKVFARSDKYYLRQYEDETNLICHLLLDQSESMHYRSNDRGLSKLEYAQLLACSLAYLVLGQQDSVGLVTFSSGIDDWLAASSSRNQLEDIIRIMERPKQGAKTDFAATLRACGGRIQKPGVVVLLSDLFGEPAQILDEVKLLKFAGHDVILMHVLDPAELSFPFDQMTRFEGLEGTGRVVTDPMLIGGAFRRAMEAFCNQLESGIQLLDQDYFRMQTDESLAAALPRVLASRLVRRR